MRGTQKTDIMSNQIEQRLQMWQWYSLKPDGNIEDPSLYNKNWSILRQHNVCWTFSTFHVRFRRCTSGFSTSLTLSLLNFTWTQGNIVNQTGIRSYWPTASRSGIFSTDRLDNFSFRRQQEWPYKAFSSG